MIYETNIAPGMDKRTAVECDKPGCPTSEWMPGVGSYTAAERMRLIGWEVPNELISGTAEGYRVRGYAARCPEHAESPTGAHEHAWNYVKALDQLLCRMCGTRHP
jgi:hypothetical protein